VRSTFDRRQMLIPMTLKRYPQGRIENRFAEHRLSPLHRSFADISPAESSNCSLNNSRQW